MRGPRPIAAALVAILCAGCESGPRPIAGAVDPRRYTTCQDAEGRIAWENAVVALGRGDPAAALPLLQVALARCPDLVRAHRAYQDAARQLGGDAERAMLDYYRSLPDRDSPVPAYAKARLGTTSYSKATELRAILARDGSFAWAHWSLGRLDRRQGQLLQAIDSFEAAFVHDPTLLEARLERAEVLVELGRFEEAAVDYQSYLRGHPEDEAAARAYLALLLYRLGRVTEAEPWLQRLIANHPDDLSLRMDRAASQWRGGDPHGALATYVSVVAAKPDAARALLNIGLLYYEVLPSDEADRRRLWPKARAAFRWFLAVTAPLDGHEHFEQQLAVPYRLKLIDALLGPAEDRPPTIEDLRSS
jgi:tetratricopeptide (TPR) repeat protein